MITKKPIPLHALSAHVIFLFLDEIEPNTFLFIAGNSVCYMSYNGLLVFTNEVYQLTIPLF